MSGPIHPESSGRPARIIGLILGIVGLLVGIVYTFPWALLFLSLNGIDPATTVGSLFGVGSGIVAIVGTFVILRKPLAAAILLAIAGLSAVGTGVSWWGPVGFDQFLSGAAYVVSFFFLYGAWASFASFLLVRKAASSGR